MARYIITYDLSAPGRNYDALYEGIKAYGTWGRITESSWAIVTSDTAATVRDNLSQVVDSNDKLFVGTLSAPWASWGLGKDIGDWLRENT